MLAAWAQHDVEVLRSFVATVTSLGIHPAGKRVLDVGCGANAPMTLMLHAAGALVTGIDECVGYRWGLGFRPSRYARYVRESGGSKALRKLLGEIIYDRYYYSTLSAAFGARLSEAGLDLRAMNGEKLEFAAATFDVVHSNATWEHLRDVGRANAEVARVLRPGGLAYIEVHLFPSLSGGHDLPWIVPGKTELDSVTPWEHLRNPAWKEPMYLNRLRERDYRRSFETTKGLEIVEWRTEYTEGEELVTDELLREELSGYTREELTKRSVIVVARKRTGAQSTEKSCQA
jgi:SAM-dependent methyltransferase